MKPEPTVVHLLLPSFSRYLSGGLLKSEWTPALQQAFASPRWQFSGQTLNSLWLAAQGLQIPAHEDWPMAAWRMPNQPAICADPCFLRADGDKLRLFSEGLDLSLAEAESLVALLQPLFAEAGGTLVLQAPDAWTLRWPERPALRCTPMPKLEGQALHPDLLDGEGRAFWLQLSSEIQMSLHNCVVNEARVQAGKWPINSVWFWGNGPARSIACAWQQVIAQSPMPEWLGVEIQQRLIRAPVVADIAALGPGAHLWCVGQTQALPDADDITLLDQLVQRLNAGKLSAIHCWVPQLGHVALQAPKQRWWWPF